METETKKQESKPRKTIKKTGLVETKEKHKASSVSKETESLKNVNFSAPENSFEFSRNSKNAAKADKHNLIAVIRIAGQVKVKEDIKNTLYRLRLRRKYVCILINPNNQGLIGMLNRVKYHVAFGEIEKHILEKLLSARGKKLDGKKINSEESASDLMNGKNLEELGIKPFFRLHPPRGGIKSKLQYPRGVLGNNKNDINKLIERML